MTTRAEALEVSGSVSDGVDIHFFGHRAMACEWGAAIVGHDAEYAEQAALAAFDEVDRLERELSRFIASSDVFRINGGPPGEAVLVGLDLLECLRMAEAVSLATGGAFDITVGRLLDDRRQPDGLIARDPVQPAAPRQIGMDRLAIDYDERLVARLSPDVSIDLGAIGKGYGLDQMALVLRDWGVATALLHSGQSTVQALGAPPGEAAWQVALRRGAVLEPWGRIALRDRALSGSGEQVSGYHIMDPRRGEPVCGKLGTWCTAPSAALSDAFSTAFMVMAPAEVVEVCRQRPELGAALWLEGEGVPNCLGDFEWTSDTTGSDRR